MNGNFNRKRFYNREINQTNLMEVSVYIEYWERYEKSLSFVNTTRIQDLGMCHCRQCYNKAARKQYYMAWERPR